MTKKISKTPAMRVLETAGISYIPHDLTMPEGTTDAITVAELLKVDPLRVFKTLVCQADDGSLLVAIIPGASKLDLKKLAKSAGHKSCQMIKNADLKPLTGYIHGGCSPFAMKKDFPCFVESYAEAYDTIFVSAGQIGRQLEIAPQVLIDFRGATFADLIQDQ